MKPFYTETFSNWRSRLLLALLFPLAVATASAQDTLTIGTGTSGNYRYPINRSSMYSASEMLYSKVNIGRTGLITNIAFYQTAGNGGNIYPCNVYMKLTSDSTVALPGTLLSSYTQVWKGSLTAAGGAGWKNLKLQLPYYYSDSTKNLSIIIVSGRQSPTTNYPTYQNSANNIGKCAYYSSNTTPWSDTLAMTVVNNLPNLRLTVAPAIACSGTPAPGNTVASANIICPGEQVSFATSNIPPVIGLTYQWQKASDSLEWSNITEDAKMPFYTSVPATGSVMYYRANVSCGNDSAYAAPQKVSSSFLACYCTSVMDCSFSDVITQVTLGSNAPSYTGNACAAGGNGYSLNVTANPVLYLGNTGTIAVATDGDTEGVGAWIDFNQDGVFSAEEKILSSYSNNVPYVHNGTFSFPPTTISGSTMMRVITEYGSVPTNPCSDAGDYGEAEDYMITLSAPLALTMGDVAAANFGSNNRITWNTLHEDEGTIFTVEKSNDGKTFTALATLKGTGRADNYQYWDNAPNKGITYYRIKTTELSANNSNYSKTVQATTAISGSFGLQAFPNPATSQLTLTLTGTPDADQHIMLSDATGSVLYEGLMDGAKATLDMSNYATGIYLLQYVSNSRMETLRIVKQ